MSANPYILHTNKIESASAITVTSEATGFEKEKAYDHRTSTFWQYPGGITSYYTVDMGSSIAVTAWACYAQDLYKSSETIKLQYSSDNFSADINDYGTIVTPTDSTPIMKTGASQSARYWRWEFLALGSGSNIGLLWLGEYLETNQGLSVGFEPLNTAQRFHPVDSVSQDGEFVGRTVKEKPIKGMLNFVPVQTPAYIRGDWVTMLRAIELHPFFVIPLPDSYASEVYYCWTDKKIANPRYTSSLFMGADIPIFAKVS